MSLLENDLVVDLFCGGGGASEGIRWALDRDPDVAVNHDEDAVSMHETNHPDTRHLHGDVWHYDPRTVVGERRVGLLWASPTCFPAGTLIFTSTGMKPIEDVRIGDSVLTHRNRWRAVTRLSSRVAETLQIRGHGHYGLVTTSDHLFYSKHITKRWPRGREGGKRPGLVREIVENPYWPRADSMKDKLWASPKSFPQSSIPTCSGASFSTDFFYYVGRWLGDGFVSKGDVLICEGAAEFEEMRATFVARPLRRADGSLVVPRVSDMDTPCPRIAWGNAPLETWLCDQFGSGADKKCLPTWCLSMQTDWRRALLEGYLDSDGCIHEGVVSVSSVSKSLAVGVRLLAISLGHVATLYRRDGRPGAIAGRTFEGSDIYRVEWRETLERKQTFEDTTHVFSPVREVEETGRTEDVYCLEVEEDHSYVADGIVVHNCTFFSQAKGGPLDRKVATKIRALATVVVRWARTVRPRVIMVENVKPFANWGPLLADGKPCLVRRGKSFRAWVRNLENAGYRVEWRALRACDYGAPTSRERLFIIARCDGESIVWPEATHGAGAGLEPYLTAADCIDWSIPCPSIFGRKKPLVEATMRRIARGVRKFVLEAAEPFLVPTRHTGDARVYPIHEPVRTVTASNRGELALVVPSLVHVSNGERPGQAPRIYDIREPLRTVVAGGVKQGLVTAFLAKNFGGHGSPGADLRGPMPTVTCRDHHSLVTAFLTQYNGTAIGAGLELPMKTLTTEHKFAVVMVRGEAYTIADIGMRLLEPRELYRAQGFPDAYIIDRWTKTAQIRMAGNSVPPHLTAALVRANVPTKEARRAA